MRRVIDSQRCVETPEEGDGFLALESRRVSFINKQKIRRLIGNRKLGLTWLVIDPVITASIYLFVFIVIRSNPNPETIFIGIALYRIMQKTFLGGTQFLTDFSGGLKAERVSSSSISRSLIRYRVLDNLLQSIGVGAVLYFFFDSDILHILFFVSMAQLVGFLFEGMGISLFLTVKRIPDLHNIFRYLFQLLFFASPCLYPMSITSGLHYTFNEYNPFTYFVESTRMVFGLDSTFNELSLYTMVFFAALLAYLSFLGFSRVDKIRWEVSRWGN